MVVLKSSTMGPGAQCVMIAGISRMPMSFVVSWDSQVRPPLLVARSTVRGLGPSGWMMSRVMEERSRCLTALMQGGELKTAATLKMLVWFAYNTLIAIVQGC